jgi:hypothetical protein
MYSPMACEQASTTMIVAETLIAARLRMSQQV